MTSREIMYASPGGVPLRATLHMPRVLPATAIVLFFGGGWLNGDFEQFRPQCEHFAARGLVAVRGEYRVRSRHDTTPFHAMEDARALLHDLRVNATTFGIDPTRIAAGGGSAGGHVAACAAFIGDDGGPKPPAAPDALVLFNPVLDTTESGFGHDRFGGRGRDASPLHHVRPGAPPTLILHGTQDTTVPITTARAFRDRMHAAGNRCELVEYPGVGHGFFNAGEHGGRYFHQTLAAANTFLESIGFIPPG